MRQLFQRTFAKSMILVLAGLFAATGLAGTPLLAQAHAATQYRLTIVAHNNSAGTRFWFSMPDSVHAGRVEVHLVNDGTVEHMAQFFKLKSGVSESFFLEELAELFQAKTPAASAQKIRDLLRIASAAGGADSIQPGAYQDVVEHLTPGRYVAVCLDTTPTGVPHFLLGMHELFTAVGDDDFTAPAANGTVIETDHLIQLPRVIHESRSLILRVAVSSQTHELQLASVPAGTTKEQLLDCLQGKKCTLSGPPMDAGGAAGLAPGQSQWVELHLKPGTYVAWCFVPDIHTGMPHALMGMLTVFTVEK